MENEEDEKDGQPDDGGPGARDDQPECATVRLQSARCLPCRLPEFGRRLLGRETGWTGRVLRVLGLLVHFDVRVSRIVLPTVAMSLD